VIKIDFNKLVNGKQTGDITNDDAAIKILNYQGTTRMLITLSPLLSPWQLHQARHPTWPEQEELG
jgi:hypothetical protein